MIYKKQFKHIFLIVGKRRGFGLGVVIDGFGVNFDLGPFWVSFEF
jgi:hypothetical protein